MNRKDTIDKLYEIEEKIPRKLSLNKYDEEAITSARQTLEKPNCVCLIDLLQRNASEISSAQDTLRIYLGDFFISTRNYNTDIYNVCKQLGILYEKVDSFGVFFYHNRPQLRIFLGDTNKF